MNLLNFHRICCIADHVTGPGSTFPRCSGRTPAYSATIGLEVPYLSVRSIWPAVLFTSAASSLIFCLDDLLTVESGVCKDPTFTEQLSTYFFL